MTSSVIIPRLFETAASRMIRQTHERIARRGHALQSAE